MANYKSGMKMQIGSKEKNTPSNFSESAFKRIVGPGGSAGMGGMDPGNDFFENIDPMNSLGQNQVESMKESYDEMNKAGYQPPVELVSKNTSGSPEAYASFGRGLKKLLKPKEGSEAYYRQQERKANREVERYKRGKVDPSDSGYKAAKENLNKFKNKKGTQTKVGKKLRKIFNT